MLIQTFHCHFEIAKGKFIKCYSQNKYGTWQLPNSVSPDIACVIDDCIVYFDGQPLSSGHKMNWKKSDQIPGIDKPATATAPKPEPKPTSCWISKDGKWQYIDKDGNLVSSQWIEYKKTWYYIKADGYAAQGEWLQLEWKGSKRWFYFNKADGHMMSNCWLETDNKWYYVHDQGNMAVSEWIPYDGEWYYVDEHGAMLKDTESVIDGLFYTFDSKGRMIAEQAEPVVDGVKLGVDISEHNGSYDVTGQDFVIIRAAWGTNTDKTFEQNVKKCIDQNIPWGVYLYSYATKSGDGVSEAEYILKLLGDRKPPMGVWYDLEWDDYTKNNGGLTREVQTTVMNEFCEKVKEAGHHTGVYSSPVFITQYLPDIDQPVWLAWWDVDENLLTSLPYYDLIEIWQYTVTDVDQNKKIK